MTSVSRQLHRLSDRLNAFGRDLCQHLDSDRQPDWVGRLTSALYGWEALHAWLELNQTVEYAQAFKSRIDELFALAHDANYHPYRPPPDKAPSTGRPLLYLAVERVVDHLKQLRVLLADVGESDLGVDLTDEVFERLDKEVAKVIVDRPEPASECNRAGGSGATGQLTGAAGKQAAGSDRNGTLDDPIPIAWLRTVVTQDVVKGASDKLTVWCRRRNVQLAKVANKWYGERRGLLQAFSQHPRIKGHIERYGRNDDDAD